MTCFIYFISRALAKNCAIEIVNFAEHLQVPFLLNRLQLSVIIFVNAGRIDQSFSIPSMNFV